MAAEWQFPFPPTQWEEPFHVDSTASELSAGPTFHSFVRQQEYRNPLLGIGPEQGHILGHQIFTEHP